MTRPIELPVITGTTAFDHVRTSACIVAVLAEGARARLRHGDAPLADDEQALAILVEEVGEVAKAFNQNKPDEFRKEMTQVASVALRYLAGDLSFSRKP